MFSRKVKIAVIVTGSIVTGTVLASFVRRRPKPNESNKLTIEFKKANEEFKKANEEFKKVNEEFKKANEELKKINARSQKL